MLQPVPQLNEYGCAVACVAMLIRRPKESAEKAYNRARALFEEPDLDKRGGQFARKVEAALQRAGMSAKFHRFGNRRAQDVPQLSIIRAELRDGERHCVVFDEGAFVDPMDTLGPWKDEQGPQRHGMRHERWPRRWRPISYVSVDG